MKQTLALLLDSYRELNARRLFWIVLLLSGLVVGAFAMLGLKDDTITILWWNTPLRADLLSYLSPATFYKDLFDYFGIGFWLSWLGNILALVSTAGVFPDFIAAGSIDLYLSKPISRLRLFLTKYAGGLIFVTLQVSVFSLCSFLVLGLRGHSWRPAIFLAVPLVVLVFSYLFSICVLLGVLTRSTIAAMLLTLLIWFAVWGVHFTELALLHESIIEQVQAASLDRQIEQTQELLAALKSSPPSTHPTVAAAPSMNPLGYLMHTSPRVQLQSKLDSLQADRATIGTAATTAHEFAYAALAPLPKTSGTTDLLTRWLSDSDDAKAAEQLTEDRESRPHRRESFSYADRMLADQKMTATVNSRTATWTLGTSLAFELVVLSLAAWIFCRRDY